MSHSKDYKLYLDNQSSKRMSHAERAVFDMLVKLGVEFYRETYAGHSPGRKPRPMRFDFFVPLSSRTLVIEVDGIQHAEPQAFFGGGAALEKQLAHDKAKERYARSKGHHFVRIPASIKRPGEIVRDLVVNDLDVVAF